MTVISPITNERGAPEIAPGFETARAFVALRERALLVAGARPETLAYHDLQVDDSLHLSIWDQWCAQEQARAQRTERFIAAVDGETGEMEGAVEVVPATAEYLASYQSPLDRFALRRQRKPEASSIAIITLIAAEGEKQLDTMAGLLRHVVDNNAETARKIYFGVPIDSSNHPSPAYFAALEQDFTEEGKHARLLGVKHTLLSREVGLASLLDYYEDES